MLLTLPRIILGSEIIFLASSQAARPVIFSSQEMLRIRNTGRLQVVGFTSS